MAKKSMDIKDAAKLMGTTPAKATSRLLALGYKQECSRCGGSGRYSWNAITGDVCFGCNGSRYKLVALSEKLITEALARIAAGDLNDYFARGKARGMIKTKAKAFTALYLSAAPGKAYSGLPLNGEALKTPEYRAVKILNAAFERVCIAERNVSDPLAAVAEIDNATAVVNVLCAAWDRWVASSR